MVKSIREEAAFVQQANGLATHVDTKGRPLHGKWFVALDIFHKGFARARHDEGWHHINRSVKPRMSGVSKKWTLSTRATRGPSLRMVRR
jgi:hypothetical protein